MTFEEQVEETGAAPAGRFALQRHVDGEGEHFDLRLEEEGYLVGWRIEGGDLDGEAWACVKGPHPVRWLEPEAPAEQVDAGTYAWTRREGGRRELALEGARRWRVRAERVDSLGAAEAACVVEAAREAGVSVGQAAGLIQDGALARQRAEERLCGLGRELDGAAFEETAWRSALAGLRLEDIQAHLRSFEARFDRKYPPSPVSRPEPLEDETGSKRAEALDIVRGAA
jgi:hypothetical protein